MPNMTKKIIRIFIFAASVLLSASLSVAQNVPPLPVDPSVTYGVLPDNISYYIVSNPTDKGFADFCLEARNSGKEGYGSIVFLS